VKTSLLAGCAAMAALTGVARADDAAITVQSLIGEGYTVASSFMSQIGPGLFLQKADKLFLCFVTEHADAKDLTTKYCKPVH
jgi:hypothetical protein